MSDLGGLQLLPSQKRAHAVRLQGNNRLLALAIVFFVLLGISYGVFRVLATSARSSVADTEKSISALYAKRQKVDEEKLLNFQKQLGTMRALLKSHTAWSTGFIGIQKLIEPRMKFLSLEADRAKQSYSFHAVADTYTTIARQVAAFYGSELVKDVSVSTISVTNDGQVDVTMQLILNPHE
ncbi:MAG: hypothetical protein Q7R83_00500 [bacterium]|nr:hypothetical protein [bacterium]